MSCFKIVFDDNEDLNQVIEIHHPPEAIEEVEVPVYMDYCEPEMRVGRHIKLKACKECGLYVRSDDGSLE